MYEKTLIKLRKPIFLTKFEYDENTNNNAISARGGGGGEFVLS